VKMPHMIPTLYRVVMSYLRQIVHLKKTAGLFTIDHFPVGKKAGSTLAVANTLPLYKRLRG
jgi:hypothetical protein